MDQVVRYSIAMRLDAICFTDHVDYGGMIVQECAEAHSFFVESFRQDRCSDLAVDRLRRNVPDGMAALQSTDASFRWKRIFPFPMKKLVVTTSVYAAYRTSVFHQPENSGTDIFCQFRPKYRNRNKIHMGDKYP